MAHPLKDCKSLPKKKYAVHFRHKKHVFGSYLSYSIVIASVNGLFASLYCLILKSRTITIQFFFIKNQNHCEFYFAALLVKALKFVQSYLRPHITNSSRVFLQ